MRLFIEFSVPCKHRARKGYFLTSIKLLLILYASNRKTPVYSYESWELWLAEEESSPQAVMHSPASAAPNLKAVTLLERMDFFIKHPYYLL